MNFRLMMRLVAVEGALQRMLGTLEHRGFRVVECRVATDPADPGYQVDMEVEGERHPDLLCRQLARLHDLREVAWAPSAREVRKAS